MTNTRIWDFDLTVTKHHTFNRTNFYGPENNIKEGIEKIFKHNAEEICAIATYHNDPVYIKSYVEKLLGTELTLDKTIVKDHTVLSVYSIPGKNLPPILISTIKNESPEDYNDHQIYLREHGKNIQIRHIMNYLQDAEVIGAENSIDFYDDDVNNYNKASELASEYPSLTAHRISRVITEYFIIAEERRFVNGNISDNVSEPASDYSDSEPSSDYSDIELSSDHGENEEINFYPESIIDSSISNQSISKRSIGNESISEESINGIEKHPSSVEEVERLSTPAKIPAIVQEAKRMLLSEIQILRDHGTKISRRNSDKGNTIELLTGRLDAMTNEFFANFDAEKTSKEDIEKFQEKFKQELHSEDAIISEHRQLWKPIVANILLALTGVGAVLLAAKAIYGALLDSKETTTSAINRYAFFGQTESEKLIENIEHEISIPIPVA